MTRRASFTGAVLAMTFGATGALAQPCMMPDPPVFKAQDRILDFGVLTAGAQSAVQDFDSFAFEGLEPGLVFDPPNVVMRLNTGTASGEPDLRTQEERYLNPDHPGAQPNVPQSDWRRVNCVMGTNPFMVTPPSFTFSTLPQIATPDMIRATYVKTPMAMFPGEVEVDGVVSTVDPYANPPGTNLLPTAYRNLRDTQGGEMMNTLPSNKKGEYNLLDGDPTAVRINSESPIDDLRYILDTLYETVTEKPYRELLTRPDAVNLESLIEDAEGASDRIAAARTMVDHHLAWGIDLMEGNDAPGSKVPGDRGYLGFAMLNHSGHNRVKRVLPVTGVDGRITGGEVTVRQIWFGGYIKSDTMFFDFGWNKIGPPVEAYANCGGEGQPTQAACANAAPIPPNKPWVINYEIFVLSRGADDFSPMVMQFDCPGRLDIGGVAQGCQPVDANLPEEAVDWVNGPLHASFDQSFFPMESGTKVELSVKMAPAQYFNLTYSWGWRKHPPRAQATENGQKLVPPGLPSEEMFCHPLRAGIIDHERFAFAGFTGPASLDALPPPEELGPMIASLGLATLTPAQFDQCLERFQEANGADKVALDMVNARLGLLTRFFAAPDPALVTEREKMDYAISKISDLAPAKRMWRAFQMMQEEVANPSDADGGEVWIGLLLDARDAYLDWLDRNHLPSGLQPDPETDLTVAFLNNTTYGQLREGGYVQFPDWRRRGDMAKITLLNGDYFPHGYLNVDFGGLRGWENAWKSTIKTAGSGTWFTFGRFHARFNTVPGSVAVGPAARTETPVPDGEPLVTVTPAAHRLMIQFNFEPSPRLRFYQFDPLHHDAAIYAIH